MDTCLKRKTPVITVGYTVLQEFDKLIREC